jgi:hypothetical protein
VLDLRPVMAWARVLRGGLPHLRMVEEPHRVFAIVAGRCCEGIEQLALLLDGRCLAILRDHLLKEFTQGAAGSIRFPRVPPLEISCARYLCHTVPYQASELRHMWWCRKASNAEQEIRVHPNRRQAAIQISSQRSEVLVDLLGLSQPVALPLSFLLVRVAFPQSTTRRT